MTSSYGRIPLYFSQVISAADFCKNSNCSWQGGQFIIFEFSHNREFMESVENIESQ